MKIKSKIQTQSLPNGNVSVSVTLVVDGIECGTVPVFTGPPAFATAIADETESLPVVLHRYAQHVASTAQNWTQQEVLDAAAAGMLAPSNVLGQSRVGADAE